MSLIDSWTDDQEKVGGWGGPLVKVPLVLLLVYWGYQLLTERQPWIFLDYANLVFHEAGHWIFLPFGEFMHILGGSLTQCLIPVIVLISFLRQQHYFAASFAWFWLGNNLINVATYLSDAQVQVLPLLGGDTTIHDWNWILTQLDWVNQAAAIGSVLRVIGSIVLLSALILMVFLILKDLMKKSK